MVETEYIEEVQQEPQPDPIPKKVKVKEFAAKIKAKYPDYKDVDDLELTNKIIAKYSEYKDQVDFTVDIEKKNPVGKDLPPTAKDTNSVSETPLSEENKEPIPIVTDYGNGEVINPKDPFAMAKAASDFSKRTINTGVTGETSEVLPDEKSIKASQEINKDLEKQGFKADFAIAVNDLPDDVFNETPKEELATLYKENPLEFKKLTNELKTRHAIRQGAYDDANENIPDGENKEYLARQSAIIESNNYNINEIATPETMEDLRGMMAVKQQNINRNIKDEDTKKKLQERLRDTYASTINANSLNLKEEYDNSDVKNLVDINQYAGLETLRIFDPAKYENYKNIIQQKITPLYSVEVNVSPEERQRINTPDSAFAAKNKGTVSPLTISEQIGQETVFRELNAIGLGNAAESLYSGRSNIIADQNKMIKESERKDITPEELSVLKFQFDESVKKVNDIQTKIGELEKSEKADDARYPQTAQLKFDAQVKEMVKDDGESVGSFMWNKFGHSMGSSVDAIENILVSNFGSKDDKAALSMKRIGEQQKFDAKTYLPENERRINSPVVMEFDDGLKKEIKKVLNGRDLGDLSATERNQLIELVKNNQDKIKTVTNPDAGKSKNFLSKATVMTVAGFTSEIAGFMTKMALLRGAGIGAKTAEAEVLFMDGYNHSVQQKLSEGASMDEANSYGILHGAILSTMVQVGSKFEAVKKIMAGGKSPLSKQIAGMSEETWNAIYNNNKSFIQKATNSAKNVAGEQVKMIGTFAGIAPTADAIADNVFYNADNTVGEVAHNVIEGSIDMAIGGLPLIGFGLMKGSMKPKVTPLEKAALWNLGDQPTIGKLKIDEAVQKGDLTLEEGELNKKTIDNVSKLITKVPTKTDKGKLMTDEQRMDYLFNLTVQENAKQEAKDLPPKQAEKSDHKAKVAEYENQIILDTPSTEKLEKQKEQLERKLEPKKDADGKSIELPEKEKLDHEAELEAVNNELETRKSFEKAEFKRRDIAPKPTDVVVDNTTPKGNTSNVVEGKSDVVDKASNVGGDVGIGDKELYDKIGKDGSDYIKKSETQLGDGVIDRNRVIKTAEKIAKLDGKSKVDIAAIAEAVHIELAYENKFDDLRKAGERETVQRMIDVGVDLPKDISDKFKKGDYDIKVEKGDYGTQSYDLKSDNGKVSGHIGDAYDWKNNKKVEGKEISVARIDAKEIGKGQGEELLKSVIDYANKNDIKYIGSTSLNEASRKTFEKLEKQGLIKPSLDGVNNKTISWEIVHNKGIWMQKMGSYIESELPNTKGNGQIPARRILTDRYEGQLQKAIDEGKFQKAISDGVMTAKEAKEIIESAGHEVPKDISEQSLSKQESGGKAPVTKPEGKSDVVVDKASNVGGEKAKTKTEPIKNEEVQVTDNTDKTKVESKEQPLVIEPTLEGEGGKGKFEEKARKLAEKIMATDIVPDWLKIDAPNVKKSGADAETIKKALADATIKMGKLLDKGVEFGEAVKEAVKDLVDLMGEGMRGKIEEGFAKDYEGKLNDLSGIKKGLVSDKIIEGVDLERVGDKEMMSLGRKILDTGEVKPEALVTKIITDGKGVLTPTEVVGLITYKRDIDNALQDTYKKLAEKKANGEDVGTLAVEAKNLERQQNDFDVMAVITAQQQSMAFRLRQRMLDREYNVVTQIEKYKANNNGEIPADVEARFREIDKELKEVKAKLVEAEKAAADKEAQAAVDNIKESVGREKKYTEEELQAELKKERISARAEKKEKVHKAIDDMMDKWAKKVSPEHLRGTDTKGTNADKVFKSVGAIMKKAYDAGEVTAKIVEDAVNYISKKLGRKDWGIEEFRKENWDEKLKSGTEKKANDKPTINEDGTVKIPNQMLRDLVKRGITDIEGLTKEVHNQVKKDLPDVTERQVRDAITDYGKEVNKTADELQTQVNTAKRVGRLLSELEDIRIMGKIEFLAKYKKPKPSESKISERERELRTQIKALGKDIVGDVSKGTKESDSKHQTRIENLEKELLRIQERRKKEPQEKSASTREIPADEKALLDEIEAEQTKWNAEKDAARQAANDYGKMETERNRQLKRVADINEKIEILKSGKLPETKSVEAKKDTPEIEALKSEKEALEKSVRESIAHEKKMKDLDAELQRLKDRKEKEPKPDSKRVISQEESLKRDEIEAERKAWDVEKNIDKLKTELQRVRDRQKKVTNPKDRRELTDTEKDLVKQIKAEQDVWNKEIEPVRKVREALKAAQKSLTEYERRIAEKDFSKKPESATLETPELKALREKRDAKRKEYEKLKKDTLPKIEKTEAERLKAAKESTKRRIEELTKKIQKKDFARPVKKLPVTDTELVKLNAEKERLQEEFDKEQYALDLKNRNVWQKWEDRAKEATNGLIRGLVASLDFSAPLVQGTMRLFTDLGKSGYQLATFKKLTPNRSINAIGTMFKHFFSEKASTAYMDRIKASEAYPLMKASKLAIGDNTNRISVKEGMFISNWIKVIWNHAIAPVLAVPISVGTKFNIRKAYDIAKVIDPYVASQRAFDGYLTSVRANTFADIATYIGKKGYTFEADPTVFQKAADFVNTTTGRGSLGKAEQAASWLDIFLFAPRKVVSEFKLFTPYAFVYYAKMPKVVRKRAIKDLGSFLGTFVTANALLWAANKDEDDEDDSFWNPNSSNFLTHKFGDKIVSIGGGAKSMITFQSRFITGNFIDQYDKQTKLGERFGKEIDTRWDLFQNFVTGKAAPAWNIAIKKMKERRGVEMDDAEVLRNLTLPMWAQDLQDMYKEDPATVNAILTALSLFGANLRVVDKPKAQVVNEEFIKANPDLKIFIDKGISLPDYNPEKIETNRVNGKVTEHLSDYDPKVVEDYIKAHQKNYKEELANLKDGTSQVFRDANGTVHINPDDQSGMAYVEFKELTDEDVKYLEGQITKSVTDKTKKEADLKNAKKKQ